MMEDVEDVEDERKQLPFFALPEDILFRCELARIPRVSRICDPHIVLCCSPEDGSEEAGRAANEAIMIDAGDANWPAVSATIEALRETPNWRRVLMTDYNCLDENGDGGFHERLYYPDGVPTVVLHWASEEHYFAASMYMTMPPNFRQFSFAFEFSLTSKSLLSKNPSAAQALALRGECYLDASRSPSAYLRPPEGVEKNPLFGSDVNIREVIGRAKKARYTQHAPSARALLATGRALLTKMVWYPISYRRKVKLEVETMAVRTLLQTPPPAEHVANQAPHPLARTDGAAPGAGPR